MLQAPSHLSRVCGHSHIKKFWLMQMQNESQACENKNGLIASSSLPVSGPSAKSPDSKHSPQRSSSSPGMRSLLTGGSSSGRQVRPLLGSPIQPASYAGVSRHTSIVTCAESLSPPVRPDQTHRSCMASPADFSAGKAKDIDGFSEELESDVSKSPCRDRDFSLSTSQCESPSEDGGVDLVDISSHGLEQAKTSMVASPPFKAEGTEALSLQLPTDSNMPSGRDNIPSFLKTGSSVDERPYIYCNVYASSAEGEDFSKVFDGSPNESHSFDVDNSDSGSDEGSFENMSSPVHGGRAFYPEKKAKPHDGESLRSGWGLSDVFGKARQTECCRRDNVLSGNLEANVEDTNGLRSNVLRICSLCGTSKTPLWRSGPHGPKSLCNACGIRFKKSKRCPGQVEGCDQLASPAASPDIIRPPPRPLKRKQQTFLSCEVSCPRSASLGAAMSEATYQHQKRSRWPKILVKGESVGHRGELTGSSESCLTLNLQSPSSLISRKVGLNAQSHGEFQKSATVEEHTTVGRVIAKDEEEAAVLLMYLSCGLVYA